MRAIQFTEVTSFIQIPNWHRSLGKPTSHLLATKVESANPKKIVESTWNVACCMKHPGTKPANFPP